VAVEKQQKASTPSVGLPVWYWSSFGSELFNYTNSFINVGSASCGMPSTTQHSELFNIQLSHLNYLL
jgi:hypothetical protein